MSRLVKTVWVKHIKGIAAALVASWLQAASLASAMAERLLATINQYHGHLANQAG